MSQKKLRKLFSLKSVTDKDGHVQITIPLGAYELENLKNEIKRTIFMKNITPNPIIH